MTRILFVCTGNTCRSPMAEAILKSKSVPGIEVRSAGVFATNGDEASQHTKKVLEDEKINLSHQSTLLTEKEVDWATFILTMTSGHKASILSMFPSAHGKTFTLKEFTGSGGHLDIMDPFGGPLEIYQYTYNEIHENIIKLIDKLKKLSG